MASRRTYLAGLTALALLPAGTVLAQAKSPVRPDDMTLGNPKAKVVVVEYASLSCPHCAAFHKSVFPAFRKKYIDSGKVLFVFREFVTPPPQLAIPATMLARCAGKQNYFTVVERVFAAQDGIYKDGTIEGLQKTLKGIGAGVGVDEKRYDACMNDQAAFDALKARIETASNLDGVRGTPTFYVNGVLVKQTAGEMDLATLDKAIAAAAKRK
ncbi:DsbA family protein [Caulobacter mirabilis]|nr:DsbA family protein [Caulobacter mirabilis]